MVWDSITTHVRVSDAGFSVSWAVAFIGIAVAWVLLSIRTRKQGKDS